MYSKSLLIAIAAFAVTATGAHAYVTPKILIRAGLTEEQVIAVEEARELRSSGDLDSARDKLLKAGINEDTLHSIRAAAREHRSAMHQALEDNDYDAFRAAVADMPLADIITSRDDFEQFRNAHQLRLDGEWEEANELLADLGLEVGVNREYGKHAHHGPMVFDLTDEQRDALQVARQANDRATIQAIFDEAGWVPTGGRHAW